MVLVKTLVRDLGYMSGKDETTMLPTLVSDMIHSFNIIQVPVGLCDEWRAKKDIWLRCKDEFLRDKYFAENLKWYKENLELPYLKHEIRPTVLFKTEYLEYKELFIEGYNRALWDCDYSHYKCVDIVERTYGEGKYSYWVAILRTEHFTEKDLVVT